MAPCDKWIFEELERGLRKLNFNNSQEIQMKVLDLFRRIIGDILFVIWNFFASVIRENGDYVAWKGIFFRFNVFFAILSHTLTIKIPY